MFPRVFYDLRLIDYFLVLHLDPLFGLAVNGGIQEKGKTSMSLPRLRRGWRRLYLCRHGETDFNIQRRIQGSIDNPLNANGLAQAGFLGQWLADQNIPLTNISSSSLTRAIQTAEVIKSCQPGYPVSRIESYQLNDMVEIHFGELEGALVDKEPRYSEIQQAWSRGDFQACPGKGGESPKDVAERGIRGLLSTELLGGKCDHILTVCHGRFNKILLASLRVFKGKTLAHASTIEQDNTCLNVLDFCPITKQFELVLSNSIAHLPAGIRAAELAKRTSQPHQE